jgi:hypothetical protein
VLVGGGAVAGASVAGKLLDGAAVVDGGLPTGVAGLAIGSRDDASPFGLRVRLVDAVALRAGEALTAGTAGVSLGSTGAGVGGPAASPVNHEGPAAVRAGVVRGLFRPAAASATVCSHFIDLGERGKALQRWYGGHELQPRRRDRFALRNLAVRSDDP